MDKIMLRNCINNDNLSFYDLLIILDTFHDFSIENNSYGYWEQNNKHRIDTNNRTYSGISLSDCISVVDLKLTRFFFK